MDIVFTYFKANSKNRILVSMLGFNLSILFDIIDLHITTLITIIIKDYKYPLKKRSFLTASSWSLTRKSSLTNDHSIFTLMRNRFIQTTIQFHLSSDFLFLEKKEQTAYERKRFGSFVYIPWKIESTNVSVNVYRDERKRRKE